LRSPRRIRATLFPPSLGAGNGPIHRAAANRHLSRDDCCPGATCRSKPVLTTLPYAIDVVHAFVDRPNSIRLSGNRWWEVLLIAKLCFRSGQLFATSAGSLNHFFADASPCVCKIMSTWASPPGSAYGTRTRAPALRGPCPNRLDERAKLYLTAVIIGESSDSSTGFALKNWFKAKACAQAHRS
jgi:hypothetical protein